MTEDKKEREPIEPPANDKARALTRAVAEGLAGLAPGGSIAANIVKVTHPPKADQDRTAWEQDISKRTNEHTERLDRHEEQLSHKETITGTTARLTATLARDCPDGLGHKLYTLDDIAALLPDEDRQDLEDAAYELETFDLALFRRSINGPWHMSLTPAFYEQLDHQVMGWNTAKDAILLADLMLAEDTGNAPTLHEKTGWPKRRFNPALRCLLPLFPNGRIRKVLQPDYVTLGIVLVPEDKAALRRFVRRSG